MLGQSGDWYEVVYDGSEGWMAGWLLTLSGPCTQLRPATGLLQDERGGTGYGKLTIVNGRADDAVAMLTPWNADSTVVAAYIRAGDSYTMTEIPDGDYALYFTLGEEWNRVSSQFTSAARRARFEDMLTFDTTQSGNTIYYSTFEVTLHAVEGGTAATRDVPASEFPNLSD